LSYRVAKLTQRIGEDGALPDKELIASFDDAVRAEEYARTLTNMELAPPGIKTWFKVEVPFEQIASATEIRETQVHRLTAGPLGKGLMVVSKDLRPIFPAKSGKISANL
jgi:hypothetical protein